MYLNMPKIQTKQGSSNLDVESENAAKKPLKMLCAVAVALRVAFIKESRETSRCLCTCIYYIYIHIHYFPPAV